MDNDQLVGSVSSVTPDTVVESFSGPSIVTVHIAIAGNGWELTASNFPAKDAPRIGERVAITPRARNGITLTPA